MHALLNDQEEQSLFNTKVQTSNYICLIGNPTLHSILLLACMHIAHHCIVEVDATGRSNCNNCRVVKLKQLQSKRSWASSDTMKRPIEKTIDRVYQYCFIEIKLHLLKYRILRCKM